MASFKDPTNRVWHLSLDAPLINKVRKACDIDLADSEGKSYQRLANDPVLLVDVLWVLVQKQAQGEGVSDEEFGRLLVGDPIEAATSALLEAIVDFFPSRRRELVKAVAEKNAQLRERATQKALERINDPMLWAQVEASMEARMDEEIRRALTGLSNATGSPDSLESAPTDLPSEN